MSEVPVPVPHGRFDEYAAAISEGFCPQCRRPFTSQVSGLSVILARCDRDACRCSWELDGKPVVPVIGWNDGDWHVWTFRDGEFPSGHRGNLWRRLPPWPEPPFPAQPA